MLCCDLILPGLPVCRSEGCPEGKEWKPPLPKEQSR